MDDEEDGDPNRPKPTGTCYRCGEEGHWARQCRGIRISYNTNTNTFKEELSVLQ